MQVFEILLSIGAGTGLIFILRWFWWRINAYTEISAMIISLLIALYFELVHQNLGFEPLPSHLKLVISIGVTTVAWVIITFATRPTQLETLVTFYNKITPMGFPFPLGLKLVYRTNENLVPWAWGINGAMSVVSAGLALIIAVEMGFRMVFLISAMAYTLSFSSIFLSKGIKKLLSSD